jgi:hypothetical protein
MYKFIIFVFIVSTSALGKPREYRLIDLEHFDMQYQEFKNNRDPYVPDTTKWGYRATANFRLAVHHIFYWDNSIHTESVDNGTVKTVGWHWLLGLRVSKNLDIFSEHHSRHVMEEYRPTKNGSNTFPLEDSYGIRYTVYDNPKKSTLGSLFD